jgi:hypothetical protein
MHDAEDFDIHRLRLDALEHGVSNAAHPDANLIYRDGLDRGRTLSCD